MREIKFRAWDKDDKVMFVPNNICHTSSGIEYTRELSDGINIKRYWQGESPNNVFLMQYTGLKDVNGKEIYEGDIVLYVRDIDEEVDKFKYEVIWFRDQYGLKELKHGYYLWDNDWELTEVIGNIYENLELLERNY